MIQPVPKSNKEEKSITQQVNLAVISPPAIMEYLHWSEQPIEFNREDHPIIVPRPGNAPFVLKAQIGAYDVDRIFMDAGSGINLIYAKTLRAMHISLEFLKLTDCSFHRIVPGSANYPLGWIALNVCFGTGKTIKRKTRLRSHGLAISISCNPRMTRIFASHGSASLYISGTQNARTKRSNYSQREF
jgi:hypothetical protein